MSLTSAELLARWRDASDQEAAREICVRYTERLLRLASARLPAKLRRRIEPADIVQSVFRSFFEGRDGGAYTLAPGDHLDHSLFLMTRRRLHQQAKHHGAQRRDVNHEHPLEDPGDSPGQFLLPKATELSPEELAILTEEFDLLLEGLPDSGRRIVELHLQGFSSLEIATQVSCSDRWVRRVFETAEAKLESRLEEP